MPRARQQDLGGQDAFVANPSIIQSSGCIVAIGDNHIGRSDTALGPFYRRLAGRIGTQKAVTATARKIAVLFTTLSDLEWSTGIRALRYLMSGIVALHRLHFSVWDVPPCPWPRG